MASIIFAFIFCIGWVVAILIAINDFRILIRGKIEEDTNMTGIPTQQLTGIAAHPRFIRLVAALRLAFAAAWVIAVSAGAIRVWRG